ncbi:glycosyltransferase family 4 protein [Clostridium sp. YIM B02515]|uniref:Glycosyltransferase family 4 protein n=1 Tax=Clostridium rhizosphaerae TaxID=2803861 RepID=A0ABS1TC68_9CLOT|nr:glycosyltransferase family 4 protein [Clostridium rhizosphaerae]MBL4936352.1 glycosyltransferase family 4 protein [Clostridium rhizosphaerae]
MIKILYIISTLERCGPVNVLYELINNLDNEKYEFYILTLSPEPEKSRYDDFKKMGAHIITLNMSRSQMVLCGMSKLIKVVENIRPDIIHTHGLRADSISANHLKDYKTCNTIHNYPYYDYPLAYGTIIGKIFAHNHVSNIKKIKYPIACSNTVSKKFADEQGIHTFTVQNGISKTRFKNITLEEKKLLRKKLNIEETYKKVFIFSGALIERKDPITLLKSFDNVSEDLLLIVAGDGILRDKLQNYKKKNILFIGNVSNIEEYLKCADIFISTSLAEGLPMAVIEAMASGLVLVLSDIESHTELIKDNSSIITFNTGEEIQLSKIINQLSNVETYGMGVNNRKLYEEHFSSDIMAKRYDEIYRKILND